MPFIARSISLAILIPYVACAAVESKHILSKGLDPRTTMANVFAINDPVKGSLQIDEKMIRVTIRQSYLFTGDESLTMRWLGKAATLVLLEGDNSVCIALGPNGDLRDGQRETVRILRKPLTTTKPEVLETLNLLWFQLTQFTYYDNKLFLDSPYYDIELYDSSGVVRRMSLYAPFWPDYADLMCQAISNMIDLCEAANIDKYHLGWKLKYEHLVRRYPHIEKQYRLRLSEQLSWTPNVQQLLENLAQISVGLREIQHRLKSEEGASNHNAPTEDERMSFGPEDTHMPTEKHNYYFICEDEGR